MGGFVCKCQSCLAIQKHNFSNMSDDLQADTPVSRAKARLQAVLVVCIAFLKYVGLFFVGIMVGGGIVLRNPPEDKVAKKQIAELKAANESLTKDIKTIKSLAKPNESVVVKETSLLP